MPRERHVHAEVATHPLLGHIDRVAGEADGDAVAVGVGPGGGVVFQVGFEIELADVGAIFFVAGVPEGDAGHFDAVAGEGLDIKRGFVVFAGAFVVAVAAARVERRGREEDGEAESEISHIDDIELRNSEFVRVLSSFSTRSSIDSTVDSGEKTLRRTQMRLSSLRSRRSSSLRVPDLLMSIAGKTRLSESLRSRCTSMLPVPLNSSKITSSIREPVSISAVAMIVSEPPSSTLRAEPKKRFGRCSAFESTPPERTLPDGGTTVL